MQRLEHLRHFAFTPQENISASSLRNFFTCAFQAFAAAFWESVILDVSLMGQLLLLTLDGNWKDGETSENCGRQFQALLDDPS